VSLSLREIKAKKFRSTSSWLTLRYFPFYIDLSETQSMSLGFWGQTGHCKVVYFPEWFETRFSSHLQDHAIFPGRIFIILMKHINILFDRNYTLYRNYTELYRNYISWILGRNFLWSEILKIRNFRGIVLYFPFFSFLLSFLPSFFPSFLHSFLISFLYYIALLFCFFTLDSRLSSSVFFLHKPPLYMYKKSQKFFCTENFFLYLQKKCFLACKTA